MPRCQFHIEEAHGGGRVFQSFIAQLPVPGASVQVADETYVVRNIARVPRQYVQAMGHAALIFCQRPTHHADVEDPHVPIEGSRVVD